MTGKILTEHIVNQTKKKQIKIFFRIIKSSPPALLAVIAVGEGGDVLAAELEVLGKKYVDHEQNKQGQGYWKRLFLQNIIKTD